MIGRDFDATPDQLELMNKITDAMFFEETDSIDSDLVSDIVAYIAVELDKIDIHVGKQVDLKINASFRSKEHELRKNRSGGSSHVWDRNVNLHRGTNGYAVDISHMNLTKEQTMLLIEQLMEDDGCRICRYNSFIHVEFNPNALECKLYRDNGGSWSRVTDIEDMW